MFKINYREKTGNNALLSYDYIKKEIVVAKKMFLEDGFANFEDINNIAYGVLKKDANIASLIAKRFPVVVIDECQDLSWIEINILDHLNKSGSCLHFVGDINQSIYEFKNASPEVTKNYLSKFKKYLLTDNFRSCHSIVALANKMLGITLPIRGLAADKLGDKSVCYLEYHDLKLLNQQYIDFLNEVGISYDKSAILVRPQSLKQDLETSSKESKHLILDAIQMWLENTPKSRMIALERAGKQMHRWFGGAKGKSNYYCPVAIDSVFKWRIFIKDFLEGCIAVPDLVNFSEINYSTWYKFFNNYVVDILQEAYQGLISSNNEKRDFKNLPKIITPKGTANDSIVIYKTKDPLNLVSINTIHSAKGKDFESVMVVSSPHNKICQY